MRVVVTGATGNIGTAVVAQLLDAPEVTSVTGVARRLPTRKGGVDWHAADLAVDDLGPVVRGADVVVHLAWQLMPSHQAEALQRINVEGTARLLDAIATEGVPAVVVASSVGAYSPGPKQPVDESWPTEGIPSSLYSRQKAAVERLLDGFGEAHPERRVVRIRPGIVMQPDAASAQARLFLGPLVPQSLVRPSFVPVVPRTPQLEFQAVHTEDVARAFVAAVLRPVTGAFNVAAEPVLDADALGQALHARPVPVPAAVLRGAIDALWRLRLLPMDPGWIDMGRLTPLMDTSRARDELGWSPQHDTRDVLAETVAAMGAGRGAPTPALRPRQIGFGRVVEVVRAAAGSTRR
ncbi:MAG: nucleoside-diphosphate-sugar epimerase [Frankiales bacterium]|nr:nucleoside-diphosphate-sugar epimerase [Frankiales bacterium]